MKTAVFLSYVSLTETILRLFPLDALDAQGLPVEYWDLSALYGASLPGLELARPYARRFADWPALEAALTGPGASGLVVTTAVPFEPRFFRLHRLLSRSPAQVGGVISGVLPMPPASPLGRLREDARLLLDPAKVAHFLLKRVMLALRRAGLVRELDFAFVAGEAAREQAGRAATTPINTGDYDDWLETAGSDPRLVAGRYAVYLDQFAAGHPDFRLLGVRRLIDADRYHGLLNAFFERLERAHGVEVVVAAHPKSDYPRNPFGGRRILRGSTRALVRFCEFAVATLSTSLGYAVLDRKPLLFFTTKEMMERYRPLRHDAAPFHFARTLGSRCLVLDGPGADDASLAPVDARLYDDYKYRYLASRQTEGRLSRDVYRDFLLARGAAPRSRA